MANCHFQENIIWDAFKAHISSKAKAILKKIKVDMAIISSRCTGLIQPGDVNWNKPLKSSLTKQYNEWLANGTHEFTKTGNMKAAPLDTASGLSKVGTVSADLVKKLFCC